MEPVTDQEILETLRGAPSWVTRKLIHDTLDTWQPRSQERLSASEALGMVLKVAVLFDVLSEKPKQEL